MSRTCSDVDLFQHVSIDNNNAAKMLVCVDNMHSQSCPAFGLNFDWLHVRNEGFAGLGPDGVLQHDHRLPDFIVQS